jgi:hypothetical protein
MQPSESILIVLLAVLVVVVALQGRGGCGHGKHGGGGGCGPACAAQKSGFTSSGSDPELAHQAVVGAMRGARLDAYNRPHAYSTADLAKNYRAWSAGPRDIEEAQRAAWFEATANGESAQYDTEAGGDMGAEVTAHHTPAPGINYQDALVDLVADPRMRAQHANWHSEVAPKSQTAMRVDDLDEASAVAAHKGHGLYAFRFAAPPQHNPLFVTEHDGQSFAQHTTQFTFGG